MASGNAWYVVTDPARRWGMELAITIRPMRKAPLQPTGEPLSVASHPARLAWKQKRRGLPWQRHDVTFMIVEFDCPLSERRFELEFSGWCPPEGFQELLQAVRHLKCH